MQNTKLLLSSALLLSASMAFGSVYIGASAGYMLDSEEAFVSAKVGYQIQKESTVSYALELEVGYTEASEFGLDMTVIPIMVNAKLGVDVSSSAMVYGGIGIGSSNIDVSGWGVSLSDDVFTYQLLFGVDFKLSQNLSLNVGYRYIRLNDVFDMDDADDNILEAGLTFRF